MTWAWGQRSLKIRDEIHLDLVLCVDQCLEWSFFDLAITEGRRGERRQTEAFASGASQLPWPQSKHNAIEPSLSRAVHIDPYPIDYENTERYFILAGLMTAAGKLMGAELRWLGLTTLRDLAHWELKGE